MGVYLKDATPQFVPSPINVADDLLSRDTSTIHGDPDIEDGAALSQEEMNALLPLGYAAAYMDRNIVLSSLIGGATRTLPLSEPIGAMQGATVGDSRITFERTGTWTVHAMVAFRGTSALESGDGRVHIQVKVKNPDGSTNSWWRVRGAPNTEEVTLTCSRPVVVTTPGMWVEVEARSGKNRWVDGGSSYSVLSVVRASVDADNPGESEVPDEPAP